MRTKRIAHTKEKQKKKNVPGNEKFTTKTGGQRHAKKKKKERGCGSNAHNHSLLYDNKTSLRTNCHRHLPQDLRCTSAILGDSRKNKTTSQGTVLQLARPAGREKVEESDSFYFSLAAPRSIQLQVQLPARAKSSKKRTKQCKTKAPFWRHA